MTTATNRIWLGSPGNWVFDNAELLAMHHDTHFERNQTSTTLAIDVRDPGDSGAFEAFMAAALLPVARVVISGVEGDLPGPWRITDARIELRRDPDRPRRSIRVLLLALRRYGG